MHEQSPPAHITKLIHMQITSFFLTQGGSWFYTFEYNNQTEQKEHTLSLADYVTYGGFMSFPTPRENHSIAQEA